MRNRICVYKEGEEPTYHNMDFYIDEIGNVCDLSLTAPTLFYISYPSTIEQERYFNTDMLSINNREPQNGATINNNKIKIGDKIEYKGIPVSIVYVIGSQVVLATEGLTGTWDDALVYCASIGEEWRLPSTEEFKLMKQELQNNYYWTIEEYNEIKAVYYSWSYNESYNANKQTKYYIQPIAIVDVSELEQ